MSATVATRGPSNATKNAIVTRAPSRRPVLRLAFLVFANLLGLFAFLWPFVVPLASGTDENHRADGPLILAGLVLCLGILLFVELGRGGLGPKTVALLGVLGAAMVALRLPGFVAGFSAMFIVVLVAGNAFGPGFGFLLGAVGTFASGLFIGGLGPWLPFQMVAVGWVGLGAGLLPQRTPRTRTEWRLRIAALAAYGVIAGYAFGALMNLWSWPFIAGGSAIGWDQAASVSTNVHHYATYYLVTSLAWDTFRAVGNAALVIVIGRPLLAALDRAARKMSLHVTEPKRATPDSIVA
jgi:energy-coupling factor transport system substrate-specific component